LAINEIGTGLWGAPKFNTWNGIGGEVESVGNDVISFKKGDPVFGFDRFEFGTYAQYKCILGNGLLVKKATNVKYEEAAAVTYGRLLALYYLKKKLLYKVTKKFLFMELQVQLVLPLCNSQDILGRKSLECAVLQIWN
jgi:NADPH:quinone reductase-like Zn-dependent oxidoreductase